MPLGRQLKLLYAVLEMTPARISLGYYQGLEQVGRETFLQLVGKSELMLSFVPDPAVEDGKG